jgi:DNA-binding IclR family transcriptional regulator
MRDTPVVSRAVPAATRALEILRVLAAQPGPVPAAHLARELDVPRSTTYHLLAAMEAEGFVVHYPEDRAFGLGMAAFEVGSAYLRHDPLERLARALLVRLVDDLRGAVPVVGQVGVLHGRETLYLLQVSAPAAPTLVTAVGVRLPAQLTASGRALLAGLPAAQVRALFPDRSAFVDRTGSGPRSLSELRRLLAEDRRRGWSREDGEVTAELGSVAAGARDRRGVPAAALAVTFRSQVLDPGDEPAVAARVVAAARRLEARLRG